VRTDSSDGERTRIAAEEAASVLRRASTFSRFSGNVNSNVADSVASTGLAGFVLAGLRQRVCRWGYR
jgi:hypothetical protein